MNRSTATLLFTITALASQGALAQDPPAPPGGFAITQVLDRLTTWSDGYRTRTDLRHPAGAPPATGWPAVLLLHGGANNRKTPPVLDRAVALARAGYVTIAYDTRENGATVALNPGWPRSSNARRLLDEGEAYFLAEQLLGGTMDDRRLGQFGLSGGAQQSLQAASFSGHRLPETGFVTSMPVLRCLQVDIQSCNYLEDQMPGGGTMVSTTLADQAWTDGGAVNVQIQSIQAGDYPGVVAWLSADVVRNYLARLATQPIPMLLENSWGDIHHFTNSSSDTFAQLLPGVARRFIGSTGIHGTADNQVEYRWRIDLLRRWCDRFLKGIANGVDLEPVAELAVPPLDPVAYLDPTRPWPHRLVNSWPATTTPRRFYLRAGNRLELAPPAAAEGPFRVRHRVLAGYDITGFMTDAMDPTLVRAKIPESEVAFDLPAAPVERELLGRVVVEFDFQCPVGNAQLSATLWAVPPAGPRHWITTGSAALRGVVPGRQHLRIVLEEIPAVVPAGQRLQLTIHNLSLRYQPANPHFLVVPEFRSADFDLGTTPMNAAFVDLPLRDQTETSLMPRYATASAAAGINAPFALRAGLAHAGDFYFVLIGGSGITPAIHLPAPLWLAPDSWTQLGLASFGTPPLNGFLGVFDAQGQAQATLQLPPAAAAALIGVRLEHVVLGVTAGLGLFTSAPATLVVNP